MKKRTKICSNLTDFTSHTASTSSDNYSVKWTSLAAVG